MAKERDRNQRLHEKHQVILADMLREEENKYCADCQAKGPRWASWNLGVFICIRCAGIHRNLGVHISRVKSVNLDSWTEEQIESIRTKGNLVASEKYEATLPPSHKRPQDDYAAETFIRNKYEKKLYISRDSSAKQKTSSESKKETKQESKPKPKPQPTQATTTKTSSIARTRKSPQPNIIQSAPSKPVSTSVPTNKPTSTTSPSMDLLTDQPLVAAPMKQNDDLMGGMRPANEQQREMKDSILSLYNTQSGYTPQGYQVGSMYYQQQSNLYQQKQLQYQQWHQQQMQSQVSDVQRQMAQLRVNQQQQPQGQAGNSTLNPHLW